MYCILPGIDELSDYVICNMLSQQVAAKDIRIGVPHTICNDNPVLKNHRSNGVQIFTVNRHSANDLNEFMQDCHSLLLAHSPHIFDPCQLSQAHNAAMAAAQRSGVKRIVFMSLSCARPDSVFTLAPYLLFAESQMRQADIDWLILRQGFQIEWLWQQWPNILKTGLIQSPIKHSHVNFVSRHDISRAAATALTIAEPNNQVLELTGPSAITMSEFAKACARVSLRPVTHQLVTQSAMNSCRQSSRDSAKIISLEQASLVHSLFASADNQEFSRATAHIEQLTGQAPESAFAALKRLSL